ncbi:hypothetical protein DFR52_101855 [Hoeflea marina]|uniref:PilZ domain-containing protein n=1 Tax=Hoeflea marina TaxID=274592 RepID=A0A317PU21_9HYPH|nr:hypothetical protein [Hoeflea marina]PWW04164.1 hypothetical protein DFR52_101855 [Hoeflea marina]
MKMKSHALTQLGERSDRRVYFRRDANCPVITHVRRRGETERSQVPAWLVNICEDGALLTSDYFPTRLEDAYVIIPGLGSKVLGAVRSQGQYTINVKFRSLLNAALIDKISRLTMVPKD